MSKVTRFAARDPGPAARLAGFLAHLRAQGLPLGVAETGMALTALAHVDAANPHEARLALRAVCTGSLEEAAQFDLLFDSFWMNGGRVREKIMPGTSAGGPKPGRNSRAAEEGRATGRGKADSPDDGQDGDSPADADGNGNGKLIASAIANLMKKDLRELVHADDIRAAELVALRLGRALRDRRSRRRRAARTGSAIDLRRTLRQSLQTGGEPLRLMRRRRPDRPLRICALCDVSGSMVIYARPFLAFLAGLMRADPDSDAYLFHTRLVRITGALRDDDPLRALGRITLLADGFGGGSRIGASLAQFARTYARRFVNGRTVVMILSDGYDSADPGDLGGALAELRQRGCRIIWLNPLKGWKDYAPVARGMAAALPHLDLFAAAATLNDLAALEKELARL
ncbi:MAG: VWA domain-containing protein [Pseudotabrizicola sp.]|uniref:vWA domain-containing protein n=1 Tax=Pseudotabrizicola sp. TaxID=2939647 RepID=UPI00272F7CF5|nr:VWA domain-containing protein [Pseudotabrizicola sp.]MDP2079499.1 VWA domain-containing protein [Pseudotabrizicola sp.]MDZ7575779.1 VWA domain-containing protein [Pseudotabrizicola sp.]